ncbi:hypothetical protein DPM19_28355 [Actinomadura craniellae]|uniref:Histidine kinase/HSP90-like ATPase domain-containing protein n=1 Tax=Actinomadura craniellae TaxID=2231787 RepID=A0A365GYJ4_9ACTN|nr:ATP-binding protein [Actinomadura craniellae]RAY11882.1 hypothetical protein DPM19_28355 [Actinomadura craniellae]
MTGNAQQDGFPQAGSTRRRAPSPPSPPPALPEGERPAHRSVEFEQASAHAVLPLNYPVTPPYEQWTRERTEYLARQEPPATSAETAAEPDTASRGRVWCLPVSPVVVRVARDLVTEALRCQDFAGTVVEDAALVVSELVTNSLRVSAPGGTVKIELASDGPWMVVGVWDAGADLPETVGAVAPDPDAAVEPDPAGLEEGRIGGWGLPMVDALATRRWIRPTSPAGKWVYAALTVPVSSDGRPGEGKA